MISGKQPIFTFQHNIVEGNRTDNHTKCQLAKLARRYDYKQHYNIEYVMPMNKRSTKTKADKDYHIMPTALTLHHYHLMKT